MSWVHLGCADDSTRRWTGVALARSTARPRGGPNRPLWCPDSRRAAASQRERQRIQPFDERRRILELSAFGEQRLIEQNAAPVVEHRPARLLPEPLHDRMIRI